MAEFKVRTRGNSDPQGKQRVYFTCHPEDFDLYFDDICQDIFGVRDIDCAIYYTEDLMGYLDRTNTVFDLGLMNLFVVPVTKKLLLEPNRAMQVDIAFAKRNNIPILPFMMESGLDAIYSFPKNFGNRQYINPNSKDTTEINYSDKLKNFLDSVLIDKETIKQIRSSFISYFFLSYRKMDREKANQLLKIIHNLPICRYVAVWYDEFLAVCNDFVADIENVMNKSSMFVMLVTPSLLLDGNFIITDEYPMAVRLGMNILPIEIEPTDRQELEKRYPGIPNCIDPYNEEELYNAINKVMPGLKYSVKRGRTPEQYYLMAQAYLKGIDVEINYQIAVDFLELAADAGMLKAMFALVNIFISGTQVNVDYQRALKWAERIVDYCIEHLSEDHATTLVAWSNLAFVYGRIGDRDSLLKQIEIYERVYSLRYKSVGEKDSDTLLALNSLSVAYCQLGNYPKAIELAKRAYILRLETLGERHRDTISSLATLASIHNDVGEHEKALELGEKAYTLRLELFGEEDTDTLTSLNYIAAAYAHLEDYPKALKLGKKVYALRLKVFGKEHPDTIYAINNLATYYRYLKDYPMALKYNKKAYDLCSRVLGEKHPIALTSLNNLALAYGELGFYQKALELKKQVYKLRLEVLGEEHPDTLNALNNLAFGWSEIGDETKAKELYEKLYAIRLRLFGADHPSTQQTKGDLETIKQVLSTGEDRRKGSKALREESLEKSIQLYELSGKLHGEEHPDTIKHLREMAMCCVECGLHEKALELYEKLYEIQLRLLGEDHPDTVSTKAMIEIILDVISE